MQKLTENKVHDDIWSKNCLLVTIRFQNHKPGRVWCFF